MRMKRRKMKKKVIVSLIIMMVLLINSGVLSGHNVVYADGTEPDAYVISTCSKDKVSKGDTITISVDLAMPTSVSNPGIFTLEVSLRYNTNGLKLVSYQKGDICADTATITENTYTDSSATLFQLEKGLLWNTRSDITSSGCLFKATFEVLDTRHVTVDTAVYSQGSSSSYDMVNATANPRTLSIPCSHSSTRDVIEEATCIANGSTTTVCNYCDEVLSTSQILATGHTPGDWTIVTEATCKETGEKELRCIDCNEVIETDIIPTTEHSFGEWTVVKAPTVNVEGEEERICSVCNLKETRSIDKLELAEEPTTEEPTTEEPTTEEPATEEPTTEATTTEEPTTEASTTETKTTEAAATEEPTTAPDAEVTPASVEPNTTEAVAETNTDSVKTGDDTPIFIVLIGLFGSFAGILLIYGFVTKKNKH